MMRATNPLSREHVGDEHHEPRLPMPSDEHPAVGDAGNLEL